MLTARVLRIAGAAVFAGVAAFLPWQLTHLPAGKAPGHHAPSAGAPSPASTPVPTVTITATATVQPAARTTTPRLSSPPFTVSRRNTPHPQTIPQHPAASHTAPGTSGHLPSPELTTTLPPRPRPTVTETQTVTPKPTPPPTPSRSRSPGPCVSVHPILMVCLKPLSVNGGS